MQKIAVLGAGIMGVGIAQAAAQKGFQVVIRDLQNSLVNEGLKTIEKKLREENVQEIDQILNRISGTTDLSEVKDSDLVIEAAVENILVKQQIFTELDNICQENTILATNTSTLSISEIASVTKRADKILGMHFFNPVPHKKLVEIIRGLETSDNTVASALEFIRGIGKEAVVLKRESPGYIVNRLVVVYINEAISLLAEGLADKEDIDNAMKLSCALDLGPLEVADRIGLDFLYTLLSVFFNETKDNRYRPHPLLATMVRAGHLGKKTGRGFYQYS
ncbi:MAG: 3-hydroxyacyl-CoA dehydrogenase family protein [Syntrophomonadaceae bacterium]